MRCRRSMSGSAASTMSLRPRTAPACSWTGSGRAACARTRSSWTTGPRTSHRPPNCVNGTGMIRPGSRNSAARSRGAHRGPAARYKRAQAGDRAADDQRVHFAGALVGVNGLGIGHETAHVVLQQDAVAAQQFAGTADRLAHPHRAERLGQRGVVILGQAGLLHLRQPHAQAGRRVMLPSILHQQVLHQLETADRTAKLLALLGVGERVLVGSAARSRPPARPRRPGSGATPRPCRGRSSPPAAGWLPAPGLSSVMCAFCTTRNAILSCMLLGLEAGRALLHHEAFDLAVRHRTRPDDHVVGEGGVADPLLLPVQHPGSPSRRAVVVRPPAAPEPTSGSVSPKAPIFSIRAIGGSQRCFCSSRPAQVDGAHGQAAVHAEERRDRRSTRASSIAIMPSSRKPPPGQP